MKNKIFNFQFSIFNPKKGSSSRSFAKAGFSLIELLIVITIIGVLSSIVLSGLSNSRAKAYDSKVKQQLSRFRTAAEIYFNNQNPNSYGPTSAICLSGMFADIDPSNGSPALYILEGNLPTGTQVECGSNGQSYAVKATLYSGNQYFCVDSTGSSRVVDGTIGGSVLICP